MTLDQKRAHLALHGLGAFRHIPDHKISGWRIARPPAVRGAPMLTGVHRYRWAIGRLSDPVKYEPRELSDIPDELLDRLDESLIEQFLSSTTR